MLIRIKLTSLAIGVVTNLSSPVLANDAVPQFGSVQTRKIISVAGISDGLNTPRDLKFNPDAPDQLWIVNQSDDSAVIVKNPGSSVQSVDKRIDRYANHFMEEVSSIAFGDRAFQNSMTFATCQESRNTYNNTQAPNDFMGPTLWPADLNIFARVNQNNQLLGSHIDMNHQSPLCMGIAHQEANKFWVFDGFNKNLVYYDFQRDHGAGHDDHADAIVRRYTEVALTRVKGVPGHMALDSDKRFLYIADTGASRILKVDITTGSFARRLQATNEPLQEYSEYTGVSFEVFASDGLKHPSGIALSDGKLFVSDHATGEIIAYDLESGIELDRVNTGGVGIMGVTVGPEGKIWFVNGSLQKASYIEP